VCVLIYATFDRDKRNRNVVGILVRSHRVSSIFGRAKRCGALSDLFPFPGNRAQRERFDGDDDCREQLYIIRRLYIIRCLAALAEVSRGTFGPKFPSDVVVVVVVVVVSTITSALVIREGILLNSPATSATV